MFPDRRLDANKRDAEGSFSFRAGLIGAAIQQSGSPAIHTAEARESGFSYSYELFDLDLLDGGVDALPDVLEQAEHAGLAGVNITHPCKQSVIPLLHELSVDARALGAVNTVVFKDGRRIGHNTDCFGFAEGLQRGLPNADLSRVTIIGAGGGGAAVAYSLLRLGAGSITINDLDSGKASALAARLGAQFTPASVIVDDDLARAAAASTGIVNCTPIGMAKYPGLPIQPALIEAPHWIADIVYFPLETEFLRTARQRGCATLDGGAMAVFQAAEAFKLFTGHTPDHARMLKRFRERASASH